VAEAVQQQENRSYHGGIGKNTATSPLSQILKQSRWQAAGQEVSIGVRVGSSTYKAVFFIKVKVQISLYHMAFVYGFQIF